MPWVWSHTLWSSSGTGIRVMAPTKLLPQLPAHLLGAEAWQGLGLLEEPHPSPDGNEDVGQVEQEGRAEVRAVFPWGRRAEDGHSTVSIPAACLQLSTFFLCLRASAWEQSRWTNRAWKQPGWSKALLRTPVPMKFPSRKTMMLITREPSQKRPRFL